ncbi:RING-H2 finger protein ATL22-like [Phaseolus vulgaris]|uniref:RING-H2 finger protein ATL22-like n=1 Tax=Phaseolus vulgaris TaxID=3885 RepID=UPI0035C96853
MTTALKIDSCLLKPARNQCLLFFLQSSSRRLRFLYCIYLFILVFILPTNSFQSSVLKVTHARFQATKCGDAGPDIHYPYKIKGQHQHTDSLPGFELLCKDNLTTIHFPSYGDLEVKSISYDTKNIHLLDPKKCVHHVFLNLNLSLTPFHYFYVLKNYTYLNCSTALPPPFVEVPCLSAASYHVYTVDSALPVPGSCEGVKTVAIPFAYSPYLSDSILGLRLTWDMSETEDSKTINHTRGSHTSRNLVIGSSMCVFVMVMLLLISTKIRVAARNNHQKEEQLLHS